MNNMNTKASASDQINANDDNDVSPEATHDPSYPGTRDPSVTTTAYSSFLSSSGMNPTDTVASSSDGITMPMESLAPKLASGEIINAKNTAGPEVAVVVRTKVNDGDDDTKKSNTNRTENGDNMIGIATAGRGPGSTTANDRYRTTIVQGTMSTVRPMSSSASSSPTRIATTSGELITMPTVRTGSYPPAGIDIPTTTSGGHGGDLTRNHDTEEMKEEEKLSDDENERKLWSPGIDEGNVIVPGRRRHAPTQSATTRVVGTGTEGDVTIPVLPTGETVDAKNTAQFIPAAARAATTNTTAATEPSGPQLTKPQQTDAPGDVAIKQRIAESPPFVFPTGHIGAATSHDVFVHARYLPEDEEDGAMNTAATTTTTLPPVQDTTTATATTSIQKRCSYVILTLIAVLLLGGIVFGSVCASKSCFSSSSSSSSSSSHNMSPTQAPPTNSRTPVPTLQPTGPTPSPTPKLDERTAQIVAYMNNVTLSGRKIAGPHDLDSAGNILEQALHWLIYDDPLQLSPDTPSSQFRMRQRYALRTIIVQLTVPNEWSNASTWLLSECQWYGIECAMIQLGSDIGQQQSVTKIELGADSATYVDIDGILPADVGLLSSLLYIDMYDCSLRGTLPSSIGNWHSVTELYLGANQLTGPLPTSIGNWQNITEVDFSNNQLNGSLPTSIGNWRSVTDVDLDDNQFTGSLPTYIGNWQSIRTFTLSNNSLTGSLPTFIGNWQNVTGVYLSDNQLNGSLPTTIGNWQNLRGVNLWNNQFTGSLPTDIGNWQNVEYVALINNQFTGTFPNSIATNWTNLNIVFLQRNQFTGTVPTNWCELTGLGNLEADCVSEVICKCCTRCI